MLPLSGRHPETASRTNEPALSNLRKSAAAGTIFFPTPCSNVSQPLLDARTWSWSCWWRRRRVEYRAQSRPRTCRRGEGLPMGCSNCAPTCSSISVAAPEQSTKGKKRLGLQFQSRVTPQLATSTLGEPQATRAPFLFYRGSRCRLSCGPRSDNPLYPGWVFHRVRASSPIAAPIARHSDLLKDRAEADAAGKIEVQQCGATTPWSASSPHLGGPGSPTRGMPS